MLCADEVRTLKVEFVCVYQNLMMLDLVTFPLSKGRILNAERISNNLVCR